MVISVPTKNKSWANIPKWAFNGQATMLQVLTWIAEWSINWSQAIPLLAGSAHGRNKLQAAWATQLEPDIVEF